ncbi:hypothetical protein Tco_0883666 [Tanacetum coccineum]
MGYHKTPTLSSNNYKKNVGVGGSGSFGGSSGLSSNTYKQKTSVGASNSARYGGSSSLSTNGYKGRSSGYGGSKIVGSVGGSGAKGAPPNEPESFANPKSARQIWCPSKAIDNDRGTHSVSAMYPICKGQQKYGVHTPSLHRGHHPTKQWQVEVSIVV